MSLELREARRRIRVWPFVSLIVLVCDNTTPEICLARFAASEAFRARARRAFREMLFKTLCTETRASFSRSYAIASWLTTRIPSIATKLAGIIRSLSRVVRTRGDKSGLVAVYSECAEAEKKRLTSKHRTVNERRALQLPGVLFQSSAPEQQKEACVIRSNRNAAMRTILFTRTSTDGTCELSLIAQARPASPCPSSVLVWSRALLISTFPRGSPGNRCNVSTEPPHRHTRQLAQAPRVFPPRPIQSVKLHTRSLLARSAADVSPIAE